jgi:hypothetical protein
VSAITDRIETLNEATTFLDLGRAYHEQADLLLEALISKAAITTAESGLPVRHVYSHAIELYLKSFLRLSGIVRLDLRHKFGHKLGELYVAARDKGLSIETGDLRHFEMVIDRLKNGHEDYEFRYFEGSISTVDPTWIQAATRSLSDSVGNETERLRSTLETEARQQGLKFLPLPSRAVMSIGGPIAREVAADEPAVST